MKVWITDCEIGNFVPMHLLYNFDQDGLIDLLESKKVSIDGWNRSFLWFKPNMKGELPYQLAVFAVMFEDGTCWDPVAGVREQKCDSAELERMKAVYLQKQSR